MTKSCIYYVHMCCIKILGLWFGVQITLYIWSLVYNEQIPKSQMSKIFALFFFLEYCNEINKILKKNICNVGMVGIMLNEIKYFNKLGTQCL